MNFAEFRALSGEFPVTEPAMPENRSQNSDFNRAFGDAKKNAANAADELSGAAQDLYDQARDSANQVADAATEAARNTASSFEQALRNTIENQPYTAVAIALGIGWLFGRLHRPL
jgi:ElaB/YqjD/DUF883 family membrane-anchored ribosome-binding protein